MSHRFFNHHELILIGDALEIAEDATGDFFKFSLGQWKRHRYDVRTLNSLTSDEVIPDGFALLRKSTRMLGEYSAIIRDHDFYFIFLQDHMILNALRRDKELGLLSLLVYIFTHELVHIVRFCSFRKRFEAPINEREKEEKAVHATTYEILKSLQVSKLDYILDVYKNHRMRDTTIM